MSEKFENDEWSWPQIDYPHDAWRGHYYWNQGYDRPSYVFDCTPPPPADLILKIATLACQEKEIWETLQVEGAYWLQHGELDEDGSPLNRPTHGPHMVSQFYDWYLVKNNLPKGYKASGIWYIHKLTWAWSTNEISIDDYKLSMNFLQNLLENLRV